MRKKQARIAIPAGVRPKAALFLLENDFLLVAERDGKIEQRMIGAGAVRQAFAAEPVDSGWLPANVRRWGVGARGHWALSWHAPAIHSVWLPGRRQPARVPMPALAFFGQGNAYYLWAMKGQAFDPKAQLFNAPCANVSGLGLICWGSNPHPDVATGCLDAMWRTFWDAPFSGSWNNGKSRRFPADASAALRDLAKRRATAYPEDDMTPVENRLFGTNCTLDVVIERMTRRGDSEWN